MDKTMLMSQLLKKGSDLLSVSPNPLCLHSGVSSLDSAFSSINFLGQLMEFGAPAGRMGRILPLLIANSFAKRKCLWILEKNQHEVYSKFFDFLGFDKDKFFFLQSQHCLSSMRTTLCENAFEVVFLDSPEFISKADLNFFSTQARVNQATYFLLRPFFLTNRLGNPFVKYRLNSSYSFFQRQMNINVVKGLNVKRVHFKLDEIMNEA